MKITGRTKLTGIIGNPVEHSLSPAIQNAAFEANKINWVYVPLSIQPDDLPLAMQMVKTFFRGINVTMPYKQDVLPYLNETSSYAELVGAVNTIKVDDGKLIGQNTDGRGFLNAIQEELDFKPEGKCVAIIGAGGAARSIATILALHKAERLIVINRDISKAEDLQKSIVRNFKQVTVDVLSLAHELPKYISDSQMIVNATPVGMAGDDIPIDVSRINESQYVVDLIYQPEETALLKKAKEKGAKTMSGKSMLIHQGAASFEIWTSMSAPIEKMKKVLEEAIKDEKARK